MSATKPPFIGGPSPWGPIEILNEPYPGIWHVQTATHGGLWLAPYRRGNVSAMGREFAESWAKGSGPGWFEEDAAAAFVVVASHQKPITSKFSREEVAFQVWEIRQGSKPGSWEITAWTDTPRADESKRLAHQVIEYSDFPEDLAPFQFYLESGVCMLKGER